ncbi:MAG: hypothetical protein LBH68_04200, partial [Bifidobacteriaceae bacterium]|nr:hypothetical protein [Bifidobacteriaceae bacterium]
MSQNLRLRIPDLSGFSYDEWEDHFDRFGLTVRLPWPFDLPTQAGFLRVEAHGLTSDFGIETGFDMEVSGPRGADGGWLVSLGTADGDAEEVWALIYASVAYFVAELGAVVEDPRDGAAVDLSDIKAIRSATRRLIAKVRRERSAAVKKVMSEAA